MWSNGRHWRHREVIWKRVNVDGCQLWQKNGGDCSVRRDSSCLLYIPVILCLQNASPTGTKLFSTMSLLFFVTRTDFFLKEKLQSRFESPCLLTADGHNWFNSFISCLKGGMNSSQGYFWLTIFTREKDRVKSTWFICVCLCLQFTSIVVKKGKGVYLCLVVALLT